MRMNQDQSGAPDPRWQAVMGRDRAADGSFVYAVRTTGVYCRPSCPARRALRRNVDFFADAAAAEAAGFRPCRRCHPQGQSPAQATAALIVAACRMIEAADQPPRAEDLARRIGLSRFHFHRQFKALTGMTPQEYARAHRAGRLRAGLRQGENVTRAIHDAGFGSGSRFYAASDAILGMSPSAFRKGGQDARIHFAIAQSSLGAILVARTEKGVCAISLGDTPQPLLAELQDRFPNAELIGGDAAFDRMVARIVGLIEAPGTGLELPLDLRGTAFQQRVWQALQQVAPGETVSYAELARRIGAPSSHRAVAAACAANTLAVAIPCHRVVRSDGALSGYRWGIARKRELLKREAGA